MDQRTEFKTQNGTCLTLVRQHQRSLPGEGGSSDKPVTVTEHLRVVGDDGIERKLDTPWKWEGQLSTKLVEAMTEVVGITEYPKNFKWTLKETTYVLTYGMRYDKTTKKWYRLGTQGQRVCESRRVKETMGLIDSHQKYLVKRGLA